VRRYLLCYDTFRMRNGEVRMMAKVKAIGYTRVSTQEQVHGFGLDVQRQAVRDYCKSHGLALVAMHTDEGLSGSNGLDTRQGLATALAAIERHEAGVLVVYRLDRLARDLVLQETTITRLRAAGASVLSVTEPDIDSEDGTRVLVRQILGAVGQYERALIRGRMMSGKAAKVAGGGYGGGRPAFGWRAEGGQLIRDAGEQQTVALAKALRAEGLSLRQIGARLEGAGHRPKVGQQWQPNQVRRVLQRVV
jgi:DNA invertase Pin-like site-specific DNA recombinase